MSCSNINCPTCSEEFFNRLRDLLYIVGGVNLKDGKIVTLAGKELDPTTTVESALARKGS